MHLNRVVGNIHRYTPITLYPTLPFYNIIIIFDTVVTQKRNIEHEKHWFQQGCHICNLAWTVFSPARLTLPAYDGGRKHENSSAWKHRIIVASTCRRSVEFGRYVTWLWMAIVSPWWQRMLALYNFAIPWHGRPAWKNVTMCARNSRKMCLIGWLHSIKGTCQPPLTLRM